MTGESVTRELEALLGEHRRDRDGGDALARAVMRHAGMGEIEQLARQAGMRTMYEDGIAKALAGVTTIEEVLRVTEDA